MQESLTQRDRLWASLAYPFWYITFILFYLKPEKQTRYLRYHTYQGFFLGMLIWLGRSAAWTVAAFVGKYMIIFSLLLYPILRLMEWAAWIITGYAALMAYLGRMVEIPYITEFARPYIDEVSSEA